LQGEEGGAAKPNFALKGKRTLGGYKELERLEEGKKKGKQDRGKGSPATLGGRMQERRGSFGGKNT